ncbi:MAG: hypothetical protein KJ062_10250 [Thermoanaerobaculia bacterium]|nr:hypothetical protein [Thermoanaerobaculia bacterium]
MSLTQGELFDLDDGTPGPSVQSKHVDARTPASSSGSMVRIPRHRPVPYLGAAKIDAICAALLRQTGDMPEEPGRIPVDLFIEKHFAFSVDFEEVRNPGLTQFDVETGRPVRIVVQRALAEDVRISKQRRVQTMMAHEAGHAILHGHLHRTASIKRQELESPNAYCSLRARWLSPACGACGVPGCFCEAQANAAIGGFLLPWSLFARARQIFEEEWARVAPPNAGGLECDDFVDRSLADLFDVNPIVIRRRRWIASEQMRESLSIGDDKALAYLAEHEQRCLEDMGDGG